MTIEEKCVRLYDVNSEISQFSDKLLNAQSNASETYYSVSPIPFIHSTSVMFSAKNTRRGVHGFYFDVPNSQIIYNDSTIPSITTSIPPGNTEGYRKP